jgi:hypothetical protein
LTPRPTSDDNAGVTRSRIAACIAAFCVAVLCLHSIRAQTAPTQKGNTVPVHATGPFDVKLAPQADDKVGDPSIARMSIDKQYHGDLEATSKGQMLSAMTEIKGSAGYVAMERVTGTLRTASGVRAGSFALQHTGTLNRGVPELSVTVVPDSATGQLTGLTGKMIINIVDGKHSYDFEYTLPAAP